jgi:hypothetical protein
MNSSLHVNYMDEHEISVTNIMYLYGFLHIFLYYFLTVDIELIWRVDTYNLILSSNKALVGCREARFLF